MTQETMGAMIARKRKENGMTQAQLAAVMNVTDKAVSKWERDLSCPDVNSLSRLAEALGVTVDELLRAKAAPEKSETAATIGTILCAIPVAMGVAVTVLSFLGALETGAAITLLSIGLASAGISLLQKGRD